MIQNMRDGAFYALSTRLTGLAMNMLPDRFRDVIPNRIRLISPVLVPLAASIYCITVKKELMLEDIRHIAEGYAGAAAAGFIIPRLGNSIRPIASTVRNRIRATALHVHNASARIYGAGWRSGTKMVVHGALDMTAKFADVSRKVVLFVGPPLAIVQMVEGVAFLNGMAYWRDACGNAVPMTIAQNNYTYCENVEQIPYLRQIRENAPYEQINEAVKILFALPFSAMMFHGIKILVDSANTSFN